MCNAVARFLTGVAALALCCIGWAQASSVLLNQTNAVGLSTVAQPSQYAFSVSGPAVVTLTDLQAPAAFTALEIAVTSNDVLVGTPASINPTSHKASVNLPAAGDYMLFVVGLPDATQGFGSFGVCVALTSAPDTCTAQYSTTLATPSAPSSSNTSSLTSSFTTTVAGTYTVLLTDDAFPAALQTVSAGVLQGSAPIAVNIPPATPTQLALAANTTYTLLAAAIASSSTSAGLYGIRVTGPSGGSVFDHSYPVGSLTAPVIVDNPTAQTLTLSLSDYTYPAPLASLAVAVTTGGTLAGSLSGAGTQTDFEAAAGPVEVWTYAVAGAQPGVYGISLSSATASILSNTQVVNPGNSGSQGSYAFVVTIPKAGSYQLVATDFQFPGALTSLAATVAQNGVELTQGSGGSFNAAAGLAVVLVDAQAPAGSSGIFDVTVASTGASPEMLLDQTQSVGGVFSSQAINFGSSGGFAATLTDLGFPQSFTDLALFVSNGSHIVGKIYGGGTFNFPATPGSYVVTFVATPNSQAQSPSIVPGFGLYSLNIASAAPTVTLKSSASSVASGSTVTLTWSSSYATTCTASGATGWSGSEPTSGSLAVSLSATSKLQLSCTGPGGMASQSVSVSVTAAPPGGGGGGSVDATTLLALAVMGVGAVARRGGPRLPRESRRR